jgi:hypothetical protein
MNSWGIRHCGYSVVARLLADILMDTSMSVLCLSPVQQAGLVERRPLFTFKGYRVFSD